MNPWFSPGFSRVRHRNTQREKKDFNNSTDHLLSNTHLYINMKSALIHVLFLLCATCVFGDADIVETVSAIEGESVTLLSNFTKIQKDDEIEWRLNEKHIAVISGGSITTNGAFRDGMQLDKQTGDLKITNIRTTDSGEYELKIKTTRGSSVQTFSVKVETDPRSDGVTVVSVTEGDSVILHPDTEILRDDEILWRFREKYDIAKVKKDEDIISTFDDIADGIFRHRLHLNHQTGNLIISDITSKTSGLYEVDIKRRKHIIQKSFNVTITDKQDILSVNEGVDVTLGSGVTELHRDDRVQWRFEHEVVAKVNKTAGIVITFDDVLDGRFRGRLQLDNQTGSLIITHTRTTDSGLYYLDITSDRHVILRKFVLSVCDSCRFPDYVTLICPAFGVAVGVSIVVGILLVACGVSHCRRRRFKQVPRRVIKRSSI